MMTTKGTKNVIPIGGKSREQKPELGRQCNWSKTMSGIMVNNILHIHKNKFAITEQISRSIVESINCCLCQLIGSLNILVPLS